MLKNYLKIAFRNILKSRVHAAINITGLAVGLASVLLISLFIIDELSYDQFHEDADDIYRIAWWSDDPQTRTPHPMAQGLVAEFPQVETAVSLSPLWGPGLTKQRFSVRNLEKDITYDETELLSVDSTFFDVFSFNLVKGNKDKVLRGIQGVVISESIAKKYFGDEDPIGKELSINFDDLKVTVEGVFEDVPVNSHFHFDFLISYVANKAMREPGDKFFTWADFGHFNYIRLKPGSDPQLLQNQLMSWAEKFVDVSPEEWRSAVEAGDHFELQRITDIHLKSNIRWELEPNSNIEYIYIMLAAAILILVIACINFMNLATSLSVMRSKEIGIRKSLGAFKNQLTFQFLGESCLIAILAMILAGLIAEVGLPIFNSITGKSLVISYINQPILLIILIGSTLISGLIAGLYPSLFLSNLNAAVSLKGIEKVNPKGGLLRKSLMVFQFTVSMILIVGSIVIYHQLQFVNSKDLGFDSEKVIVVPLKNYALYSKFEEMKSEILRIPNVESVSGSSNIPGQQFNQNAVSLANDPDMLVNASEVLVEYDFFKTLGIEFLEGKNFNKEYKSDTSVFIINETAAKQLNLKEDIGSELVWHWDNNGAPPLRGTLIGIVKDFHFNSLHQPVRPLIFNRFPGYNSFIIKTKVGDIRETVASIEEVWKQFEDRFGFEYTVLSQDLHQLYSSENKTATVFSGFSAIAIFIACFGLFGMASLSYSQRKKEVGIRKILGASTKALLKLLLQDFGKLILIAIVIAIPAAWLVMTSWLENFRYHININWFDFAIAAMALVIVALITIGHLTFRTTKSNPVDVLKD